MQDQDQDQDRGQSETGLVIRPRSQTPRLSLYRESLCETVVFRLRERVISAPMTLHALEAASLTLR